MMMMISIDQDGRRCTRFQAEQHRRTSTLISSNHRVCSVGCSGRLGDPPAASGSSSLMAARLSSCLRRRLDDMRRSSPVECVNGNKFMVGVEMDVSMLDDL